MARILAAIMALTKFNDWADQLAQICHLMIGWNVAMEWFASQVGMCLVDADTIPTLEAALAHPQNLSILANRYFGELRNRIPCIESDSNTSLTGSPSTEAYYCAEEGLFALAAGRADRACRQDPSMTCGQLILLQHSFDMMLFPRTPNL